MDTAPMEKITPEAAAGVLRISSSRLRNLFKRQLGMSFHQYVIRLRLERARRQLMTEDKKVYEIEKGLGIQDFSHFFRDFKRTFGVTPAALRREESQKRTAGRKEQAA